MLQNAQGIPDLPDLTQPSQLMAWGQQTFQGFLLLIVVFSVLGIAIALFTFSLRKDTTQYHSFVAEWTPHYRSILRTIPHFTLVLILVLFGFLGCGTLSKRYHFWEQAKITQVAKSVAGELMEQASPRLRYVQEEPYTYTTFVDGRPVKVEETQEVNRFLALTESQIQVTIDQVNDPQKQDQNIYQVDFVGEFQVKNSLSETEEFFWEMSPPSQYNLLQDFQIAQAGTTLESPNPDDYSIPITLGEGEETTFRVTYKALGAPRWVYTAYNQLLSNFQLAITATFPNPDFASGIVPTDTQVEGKNTRFIWTFSKNVAVKNPFGVFTATAPLQNTGILPRLLLLAPGVFLWWILLLYLSIPMTCQNIAITGGLFYSHILALTYLSRLIPALPAWFGLSLLLLSLTWGLGRNTRGSIVVFLSTLAGAIVPILGLLVPYTGLTLAIAALLSGTGLAIQHWYKNSEVTF